MYHSQDKLSLYINNNIIFLTDFKKEGATQCECNFLCMLSNYSGINALISVIIFCWKGNCNNTWHIDVPRNIKSNRDQALT